MIIPVNVAIKGCFQRNNILNFVLLTHLNPKSGPLAEIIASPAFLYVIVFADLVHLGVKKSDKLVFKVVIGEHSELSVMTVDI